MALTEPTGQKYPGAHGDEHAADVRPLVLPKTPPGQGVVYPRPSQYTDVPLLPDGDGHSASALRVEGDPVRIPRSNGTSRTEGTVQNSKSDTDGSRVKQCEFWPTTTKNSRCPPPSPPPFSSPQSPAHKGLKTQKCNMYITHEKTVWPNRMRVNK